jgi:hypothetical protein
VKKIDGDVIRQALELQRRIKLYSSGGKDRVKLPNAERAVVDVSKLRNYCLNPEHRFGRHKARVFAASLGLTAAQADVLRSALLASRSTERRRRDRT